VLCVNHRTPNAVLVAAAAAVRTPSMVESAVVVVRLHRERQARVCCKLLVLDVLRRVGGTCGMHRRHSCTTGVVDCSETAFTKVGVGKRYENL
jgi:hypothetical protein